MDPNENPNEVGSLDANEEVDDTEPMLHRLFGYGGELQQAEHAFEISTRVYLECLAEYSMSRELELTQQKSMADLVLKNMRQLEEAREAFLASGEALLADVKEFLGKMDACHAKVAKLASEGTKAQAEAVRIYAKTRELLREIEQAIANQEKTKNE